MEKTQEQLKIEAIEKDILDLLNLAAIKLKDVSTPEIEDDGDCDSGYNRIPIEFKFGHDNLSVIKVVLIGLIDGLEKNSHYGVKRMARAYYSSFCNA